MNAAERPVSGGLIALMAAALGLAGCGVLSLSGLTGGTLDQDVDAAADAPPAGPDGSLDSAIPPDDASPGDAADASTASGPCEAGSLFCNGACVDPSQDPANCNGCGLTCATGVCGTSVSESFATAPTSWTFNGSATYNSFAFSAELTPIGNDLAGSFVYDDPIVADAFDAQFDFRMGLQGGTRSDGMGFMIEQAGAQAVGGRGGGLGMTGLGGFGAEFDIHDNGVCGDISDDHVGVDDLTLCNAKQGTPTALFASDVSAAIDLADAHWHHADVTLAQGAMSVSVDGTAIAQDIALPTLKAAAPYYFGFAGGTGGLVSADGGVGGYRQEVRNIVLTFPTPRCL